MTKPGRGAGKPGGAAERRRTRRAVAVMAATLVVMGATLLAVWRPGWIWPPDGEPHSHPTAPHGGVVVPLGGGGRHDHVEAVLGDGGALTLYMLGEGEAPGRTLELQVLEGRVRQPDGGEGTQVILLPLRQPGDPEGTTSRFAGRLPASLRGKPLEVTVPELADAGGRIRLEFAVPAGPAARPDSGDDERLYLTAAGKYTAADVTANGATTAVRKFKDFRPAGHDFRPRPGDRVCPVTGARADARCSWVVGGQAYLFCCPPCIGEFVQIARERPGEVGEPDDYLKR